MIRTSRWWAWSICTILCACQTTAEKGLVVRGATADASSESVEVQTPTSARARTLEMTYEKRCPGMEQPRSVRVSSASASMSLVDEAGEARRVALTSDRIASLAASLQSGLESLTSTPGASAARCSVTLHVVIDGVTKHIEDSSTTSVNDTAKWTSLQSFIERFAGWQ